MNDGLTNHGPLPQEIYTFIFFIILLYYYGFEGQEEGEVRKCRWLNVFPELCF
jgi:hypothetical protein